MRSLFIIALCAAGMVAPGTSAQTTRPALEEFDACGVITRSGSCFLFEGGGGSYFLSDFGGYREGDFVRVVGTLNTNCITICADADGCVAGAIVYDPVQFPCGTPIRTEFDPCGAISATLLTLAGTGAAFGRRGCRIVPDAGSRV